MNLLVFMLLGHDGKGSPSLGEVCAVLGLDLPFHKSYASAFLDNLSRNPDLAAPNALQKGSAFRYGGDALSLLQDGEKSQSHGLVTKSREKAALQPARAVVHIGPHRHDKFCLSAPVSAKLNSHQAEEWIGIPSPAPDLFQVTHFYQL